MISTLTDGWCGAHDNVSLDRHLSTANTHKASGKTYVLTVNGRATQMEQLKAELKQLDTLHD